MPPSFSEAIVNHLAEQCATVPQRSQDLIKGFILRDYISEAGKEYAHHGVARRIGTLARCIDKIFHVLPPEFSDLPEREVRGM